MTIEELQSAAQVIKLGSSIENKDITLFSVSINERVIICEIGIELSSGNSRLDGLSDSEQRQLVLSENYNNINSKLAC